MPQMVTGCLETRLFRIILHSFPNPSARERAASKGAFLIQEDPVALGLWPEHEVGTERPRGIITEVDDPVLPPFGIIDDEPSSHEVYGPEGEICHLCHPEPAAKHEREHGPVPRTPQGAEQHLQLLLPEMLGKGLRCSEAVALSNRVCHRNSLLLDQVMVELPDPLEVAVDGLGL